MNARHTPAMPSDSELRQCLAAIPGVTQVLHQAGGWWASGALLDVPAMSVALHALGLRLGTITAVPLAVHGETRIVYHWVAGDQIVNLTTVTHGGALPSLAAGVRAAGWAEREIHDLFGVTFTGHPNPAPLLRPEGFEVGMLREAMCGPQRLARSPTAALLKD